MIDGKLEAELVDQYFKYLHALPAYGFLHQSTVVQRCREHSINPALKAALCAITALFMGRCAEERDSWAKASETLVFDGLSHPSIFHLQALLLVIRYRAESGGFSRAFMLSGLAARLAAALRLNYEHHELSPVAQEVRRRTFWSLYFLEEVFCSGLREFELSHPDIIYLQLPREDNNFANEASPATSTGYLLPGLGLEPTAIGPRGLFVKLALVRRNIMKYDLSSPRTNRIKPTNSGQVQPANIRQRNEPFEPIHHPRPDPKQSPTSFSANGSARSIPTL